MKQNIVKRVVSMFAARNLPNVPALQQLSPDVITIDKKQAVQLGDTTLYAVKAKVANPANTTGLPDTDLLPVSVLTSLPEGHAMLVTQGYPPIKLKIPLLDREGLPAVSYFNNIIAQYHAVKLGEDVDERGDLFAAYAGLVGEDTQQPSVISSKDD